jgi:hypothetical protein
MNPFYRVFLLLLVAVLMFGQLGFTGQQPSLPDQPDALVQSFYRQVVARHPLGIPSGPNWKVFAPYLSKTLLHGIDLARSCQDDWVSQNEGRMVKEPFAWGEAGLFSGANELAYPLTFKIERTESKNDGLSLVYVKLIGGSPPETPWTWEVAVRLVKEHDRPAIEDVIYLKGEEIGVEYRLSEVLVRGCNGGRWVGLSRNPS